MQTQSAKNLCFKTYTGTKTIKAMPMGASDAKHYGAQITEETIKKNIGNDGYLVEYPDGYRSWSPKKAFEDAYRISETPEDFMRIELADLGTRMKVVSDMLYNPNRIGKCNEDRWNLNKQLEAMREYADQLWIRLESMSAPRAVACVDARADLGHCICCSGEKKAEGGE